MNLSLHEISQLLRGSLEGNPEQRIERLSELQDGQPGSISFLHNQKYEPFLYTTQASAVIVGRSFQPSKPVPAALLRVDNPYIGFAMLLDEYQRRNSYPKEGLEQPCFVHPTAQLGEGVYVGAFAYIAQGAVLGKNVKVYPQAYIGEDVVLGEGTVVLPGAKIHHRTEVGRHCTIHAGAVIGSDGFGFAPQPDGTYRPIPQVGKVVLEDHVSIGANTTIDRATLSATVVEQGAKLDNLIQVGHNCRIGAHTVMAAQVGVAGSSRIGDHCMIGGQVGIAGHLQVAPRTNIGAQAGLNASVEKPDTTIIGSPVMDFKAFMKSFVVYRKLPQLEKRLEALEKKSKE